MIIWFIALARGLFKSPFHICGRLTDGLPRALSSVLLLFHARPWKHPPQLRHSFASKGPTPSLLVGQLLLGTHSTSLSSLCRVHTHGPFFIHSVALYSARDTLTGLSSFYSVIRYTLTDPFFRYLILVTSGSFFFFGTRYNCALLLLFVNRHSLHPHRSSSFVGSSLQPDPSSLAWRSSLQPDLLVLLT